MASAYRDWLRAQAGGRPAVYVVPDGNPDEIPLSCKRCNGTGKETKTNPLSGRTIAVACWDCYGTGGAQEPTCSR